LLLVGTAAAIESARDWPRCTLVVATEVVAMDDGVEVALRRKRDSSMRVAIAQLKPVPGTDEPAADVCVSAGNTGALMALARYVLKTFDGIDRPAIAAPLPNMRGGFTQVLDLGANVDCSAEHLLQFAVMGSALVSALEGKDQPSVGLLNIGEEAIKGGETIKRAGDLLRAAAAAGQINFYGNVEGNDIFKGTTDLVVCDGFVGNVLLKTAEGLRWWRCPCSSASKTGSTIGATAAVRCWACAVWCSRPTVRRTRSPSRTPWPGGMMPRAIACWTGCTTASATPWRYCPKALPAKSMLSNPIPMPLSKPHEP
jgi:hypothetical protein